MIGVSRENILKLLDRKEQFYLCNHVEGCYLNWGTFKRLVYVCDEC